MNEPIEPTNDQADEVSADEVEESKTIDIRKLGIEPLSTPIPAIAKVYRKFVEYVRKHNEAKKGEKADPSDPTVSTTAKLKSAVATKDGELAATVSAIRSHVRGNVAESFFGTLEKDNTLLTSYVALEELRSLLSDAEDNHDYYFARAVQAEKDRLGITVTPDEEAVTAKLTAVALNNLLQNRINIAQAMGDELPEGLFKTSDAGRVSFNTDIIPRLPKLDMGDAAPRKSVSNVRLAFRFVSNGTEVPVPANYTLNDVAHNVVSKGAYRVSGARIAGLLKEAKLGLGATKEEWSLSFETGTLYGKAVSV
jgi:hypothetical protein